MSQTSGDGRHWKLGFCRLFWNYKKRETITILYEHWIYIFNYIYNYVFLCLLDGQWTIQLHWSKKQFFFFCPLVQTMKKCAADSETQVRWPWRLKYKQKRKRKQQKDHANKQNKTKKTASNAPEQCQWCFPRIFFRELTQCVSNILLV